MFDAGIETLFHDISPADLHPGRHIMTGPIFVEGVRAGDMLDVRYLRMTPRCRSGSNLAAHWGYLYGELGSKERVTIYKRSMSCFKSSCAATSAFPRRGSKRGPTS